MTSAPWLTVTRGTAPLLVSLPHTGTDLVEYEGRVVSPVVARRDCDWWIDKLYDFSKQLGATVVHTAISRTVIDVNRDPSGVSLYPGQTTTGLCPTETFDGDPLYPAGQEPSPDEIAQRRERYFDPYHVAIAAEIKRLRGLHDKIVIYDCHSIRSVLPRLFEGTLPVFNLGTNDGKSTDPVLQAQISGILDRSGQTRIVNGRFKGGWITRHYGRPDEGVHGIQMEIACRGYMREPEEKSTADNWPVPYDADFAAPTRTTLTEILETAIAWAKA